VPWTAIATYASAVGDGLRLPDDPTLRAVAEMLESGQIAGELFDQKWRICFMSTEQMRVSGLDPDQRERYYGISTLVRDVTFPGEVGTARESAREWWRTTAPVMRHDVPPDDPAFEAVFGPTAERARAIDPVEPPATMSFSIQAIAPATHETWHGPFRFSYLRLFSSTGRFVGTLALTSPEIPQSLALRLARGDRAMYERMDRLRDPARRPAAILFADLTASGQLSRRLSSRAYFELIRSLTDLIDSEVIARQGIIGRHAGDGASALFTADEEIGGESGAARAAIMAARAIRDGAGALGGPNGPEVRVRVGIHWGATLTVGQVSTRGRLEVTALGDEMNEAARIESAATGGAVLASKGLIERLSEATAQELGIEPDSLTYHTIAELTGGEKEHRDAGMIAVVEI
jgi:class 3 adenylate cyclase